MLFAKACELFILDLTMRSWSHADSKSRRTLQREDVATAVAESDMFDFLLDVVPKLPPNESSSSRAKSPEDASNGDVTPSTGSLTAHNADEGRIRRPILDPLAAHAQDSIISFMPVSLDSKQLQSSVSVSSSSSVPKNNSSAPTTEGNDGSAVSLTANAEIKSSEIDPVLNTSPPEDRVWEKVTTAGTQSSNDLRMNLRLTDPTKIAGAVQLDDSNGAI